MSNQPPYGQGPWQQPPAGPPPGQGGPPPGPPPGPPGPGGPPPPPGGYPPGGPGGPPPSWGPGGPPQYGSGGPPRKSKVGPILAVIGAVVVLVGGGLLVYFLAFSGDDDDEASGGGGGSSGGGGDSGEYCTLLEDNYEQFQGMTSGNFDPADIEQAVGVIHDLRDAAPEELADEWAQLDDPFRELEEVLDEAGLSWSDLSEVTDPADVPPEVAGAAQQFIQDLSSIDQEAVDQAIDDHAKDECGLEIEE